MNLPEKTTQMRKADIGSNEGSHLSPANRHQLRVVPWKGAWLSYCMLGAGLHE